MVLKNPVLTASGTAGHGVEMAGYLDYSALGGFVTQVARRRRMGRQPGPRLRETPSGLLNSVGLQGPGVEDWRPPRASEADEKGRDSRGEHLGQHGRAVRDAPPRMLERAEGVVAVEVNVSCPNLEDRSRMFAHSRSATAEAVDAVLGCRGFRSG